MKANRLLWLLAATSIVGCSHPLLLKKYVATNHKVPALAGRRIFVAPYLDQGVSEWEQSTPLADPVGFARQDLSDAQLEAWEAERDKLELKVPEKRWRRVGQLRNGFGIPIKDVMSVNGPAAWLTDALKLELKAQGANLVDTPEAAEVVVNGTIRHVWLDLYMAVWVHIVLDLSTTPRGGAPTPVRIHVSDSKLAWSTSAPELYGILSSTEQKLECYVLDEIARAVGREGEAPSVVPSL